MFSYLFSCCVRQRRRDPTIPDERTYLIPATTACETPTPQPRSVDQQKLKERLGTVVRSKEGKMVNVNLSFPFNLHNQSLGEPPSRSASGGTLDSSRPSRHNSLSRTSLPRYPEGPASHSVDAGDGGVDHQKPILNVRLVSTTVSDGASRAVNGISRGRPGRRIEHGRVVVVGVDYVSHPDEDENNANEENEEQTPRLQTHLSVEEPDNSSDTDPSESSNDRIAPPHNEDFTIRDAGAISRSWGD
ncbi:hypothetical protein K503DRAFT_864092 [Rhizopogon vinicolor AM-OR11-026]|uniref:Uncharacterized protein n=1 Tax=Rhizopogon vinicolor AM-OR11-026 TaxID=1314800 RepID=A0A1B7N8H3_9AGAM|nr:hypothetical protein K503DRAFT_864092 [Rhizopogon vinicolor AM-OR11-026]